MPTKKLTDIELNTPADGEEGEKINLFKGYQVNDAFAVIVPCDELGPVHYVVHVPTKTAITGGFKQASAADLAVKALTDAVAIEHWTKPGFKPENIKRVKAFKPAMTLLLRLDEYLTKWIDDNIPTTLVTVKKDLEQLAQAVQA